MIPRRLSFKGIGSHIGPDGEDVPWTEETVLDLEDLPEGLIAIVGGNGEGKTHLLELLSTAVLFRRFAAYEKRDPQLAQHGSGHWYTELLFDQEDDRLERLTYLARVQGTEGGATEAWLTRGEVPLAKKSVTAYDAQIETIMPSFRFCKASMLSAAGNAGSFLTAMGPSERKDLVVEQLGLEELQEKSLLAQKFAESTAATLNQVRSALADKSAAARRRADLASEIGAIAARLSPLQAHLVELRRTAAERDRLAVAARAKLDSATADADASAAERARVTTTIAGERSAVDRHAARRTDLDRTITRSRQQLEHDTQTADRLIERREDVCKRIVQLTGDLEPALVRHATATAAFATLQAEYTTLEKRRSAAVAAQERLGDDSVAEAARVLELRITDLTRRIAHIEEVWALIEANAQTERDTIATRNRLTSELSQLTPRAGTLALVDVTIPMCAVCPLTQEARTVQPQIAAREAERAALPPPTDALEVLASQTLALRTLRATLASDSATLKEHRVTLSLQDADRRLAETAAEIAAAMTTCVAAGRAAKKELDEATADRDLIRATLATAERERTDLAADITALDLPARTTALEVAHAQRAEVEQAEATATAALATATTALAALPAPVSLDDLVATAQRLLDEWAAVNRQVDDVASTVATLEQDRARLEGARGALGTPEPELDALRAREASLIEETAEWTLLAKAFGRDGIQALEVSNAIPAIEASANDLLAQIGTSHAIAWEMQDPKVKGGVKEVMRPRIISGTCTDRKQGSSGQEVIIEEALRNGFALHNVRHSGRPQRSLFRDETAGHLSPQNADAYIRMLRCVRTDGDLHRIYFIAHQRHVWRQADMCIYLYRGTIRIVDPMTLDRELVDAA